jgi:hypothetical protein
MEINNGTAGTLRDITLRNLTASGSVTIGGAAAAATTNTKLTKLVSSIADATATAVLTVTVPNPAAGATGQAATVRVTLLGRMGAGGAIAGDEATATVSYDVSLARTNNLNVVAAISSAFGAAASNVAGAGTVTVTADLSSITGGTTASNSFSVRVTITKSGGSSTNHTCTVLAQILNATATGCSIA